MKKIAFGIWLIFSLYLCIGGITSVIIHQKLEEADNQKVDTVRTSDTEYRNVAEMKALAEYEKMMKIYPLYLCLGGTLSFILTLIAFGVFGSLVKILLSTTIYKQNFSDFNIYTFPMLGGLVGLLTIILTELLPEFKFQSGNDKMYYTIAFFGGLYTKEFFGWLEKLFKNLVTAKKDDSAKKLKED